MSIQRFFGIIRSAGGGQVQPTVTSFLHLFRMLCIYYPVNFHVKNGNVDEDYMRLLTSYHDCMLSKFKENVGGCSSKTWVSRNPSRRISISGELSPWATYSKFGVF